MQLCDEARSSHFSAQRTGPSLYKQTEKGPLVPVGKAKTRIWTSLPSNEMHEVRK